MRSFFIKNRFAKLSVLAMALGVAFGLTAPDVAKSLRMFNKVYLHIMELCVLPYIALSLVNGFGRLAVEQVRKMLLKGLSVLLALWALALAMALCLPLAYPVIARGSFYSFDPEELKMSTWATPMPANIITAFARGEVPPVVLFSLLFGLALIHVRHKDTFLQFCEGGVENLEWIVRWLVEFSPLGVFTLIACSVGELDFQELTRMMVYVTTFAAGSVILCFLALPLLVSGMTTFRYRDILRRAVPIMVLAVSVGHTVIIIPLLTQTVAEMFKERKLDTSSDAGLTAEALAPICFNLPTVGRLILISFVFFAAWLNNQVLNFWQRLQVAFSGLVSFFAEDHAAIPYLLEEAGLPHEYFMLYMQAAPVVSVFRASLSAMSQFALVLLTTYSIHHSLRWRPHRLALMVVAMVAFTTGALIVIRGSLGAVLGDSLEQKDLILSMSARVDPPKQVKVYRDAEEWTRRRGESIPSAQGQDAGHSLFTLARRRGYLVVGYLPENIPFSFTNAQGKLVGHDVDVAALLARFIGCDLIFAPIAAATEKKPLQHYLETSYCDILMSSFIITGERVAHIDFSDPYMTLHPALLIKDEDALEYQTLADLRAKPGIHIATEGEYLGKLARQWFPQARITVLDNQARFFEMKDVDLCLTTAEQGGPWTMVHPEYAVVTLGLDRHSRALGYAVKRRDANSIRDLNNFLATFKIVGYDKILYKYWILGVGVGDAPKQHQPH